MSKINLTDELESELEGADSVPKKKEKKKKSKEEKVKDRRTVFFVLLLVLVVTFVFWLKAIMSGEGTKIQKIENSKNQNNEVIDEDSREEKGFFVEYDI